MHLKGGRICEFFRDITAVPLSRSARPLTSSWLVHILASPLPPISVSGRGLSPISTHYHFLPIQPAEWTVIAGFRSPNKQDANGELDSLCQKKKEKRSKHNLLNPKHLRPNSLSLIALSTGNLDFSSPPGLARSSIAAATTT